MHEVTTVEPLYRDTPEMRTSPLIRTPCMIPATLHKEVYKITPEMRTPSLVRTLKAAPTVSGMEGFHCIIVFISAEIF